MAATNILGDLPERARDLPPGSGTVTLGATVECRVPGEDVQTDGAVEVSIVIPTMRRQSLLPALVERLLSQRHCDAVGLELVIVDNCPQESARQVVAELRGKYGARVRYLCEKRPGVSYVRNTGMSAAGGRLIGFIDDDEIPCEDWLASLLACKLRHGADAVLGPVYPVFARPETERDRFFRKAFTQSSDRPTGAIVEPNSPLRALLRPTSCYRPMATNNALIEARHDRIGDGPIFDPGLGYLGGEDVLFFHNLYLAGKKIVWCREAVVFESVSAERSELRFMLQRRFRNGQITSVTCVLSTPRQYRRLLVSMVLGMIQLVTGAGLSLVLVLAGNRKARDALSVLAAGAGKILWMRRFHGRNYGLALEEAGR